MSFLKNVQNIRQKLLPSTTVLVVSTVTFSAIDLNAPRPENDPVGELGGYSQGYKAGKKYAQPDELGAYLQKKKEEYEAWKTKLDYIDEDIQAQMYAKQINQDTQQFIKTLAPNSAFGSIWKY